jgi:hypothetical protein
MKILVCGLLSVGVIVCESDTQQAIAKQTENSGFVAITRVGNSQQKAESKGSIVINRSSSRNKLTRHADFNS